MLNIQEILKKVKELEIKSRKLTNHLFTGEYHSAFKGRGMSFKEVKEYSAGDDIRFIDWNVSARMNGTYSKVFEEERELNVYLLVDVSASSFVGFKHQNKQELITEICAVLSFSALSNNDNTGVIFFSDKVEKYIPAAKGREHVLYIVRELLSYKSSNRKTEITKALQYVNNIAKHKSIVFVLSDFADEGYANTLKSTAKRHDVIGVRIVDATESKLPKMGLIELEDSETGRTILLDTNDAFTRKNLSHQYSKMDADTSSYFRKAGADLLQITIQEDYVKKLQQFFLKRR